jgi:hypothetical protein
MIYSDLYIHKKNSLPTILGFVFVFLTAVFMSKIFLVSTDYSKASTKTAKRVEIVNVSPTQISILWQTDQKEAGWIVYGESENNENKFAFDEKDLNTIKNKKGSYIVHLATLKELSPNKKYYFKIITDNSKIITQPNGKSFVFITPQNGLNNVLNVSPAFGKIFDTNSIEPLINSYIILTVGEGYPLLTQIKSTGDGSWLIPLNRIYRKSDRNILTVSNKDKIVVEILNSKGDLMTISTIKSRVSPLPQTLVFEKDKNLSFIEEDNVLSASSNLGTKSEMGIEIIYPKENSIIPGKIPLIKGVAIPFSTIEISVNSKKVYSAVIKADIKGNWSYLLPENLELGQHTISIKTKDKAGKEITLVRKFTMVAQQGNEGKVLGTASGEPELLPTDSPTPTQIITNTPTPIPSFTPVPTIVPATPTPNELKRAGNNFSGTIFSGLGLIIVGGGILLAF